jgi:uncharacterized membrane protein YjjB (DUF3815 family)
MTYLDNIAPRSRWAIWAWSPVIVLRIALVGVYLGYVYASVIAFIAGVPIFRLTAPQGYTSIWAVLLGVSAVLSAIGSITDRWQQLEKWASLGLSSMMAAYVGGLNGVGFAEGDLNRQFAGAVAAIAFILPAVRFVYLAAQTGKRRRVPRR